MFAVCNSRCRVARECARHTLNTPDPRVRNQKIQEFEPQFGKDCYGYIDLNKEQKGGKYE